MARFKHAGAPALFNEVQVEAILKDLCRHSVKEVSILYNSSTQTIYNIKGAIYPYNYVAGTESHRLANLKRIRNQEIVLEKIAANENKEPIAKELGMGVATIYKINKIWTSMTDEEKTPYYQAVPLEGIDSVIEEMATEATEDTKTTKDNPLRSILNDDEIESLGNIMNEIEEEAEEEGEEEEERVIDDLAMFEAYMVDNIVTQAIKYPFDGFEIWKVEKYLLFPKDSYVFIKENENIHVSTDLALELIQGRIGTPFIIFEELDPA